MTFHDLQSQIQKAFTSGQATQGTFQTGSLPHIQIFVACCCIACTQDSTTDLILVTLIVQQTFDIFLNCRVKHLVDTSIIWLRPDAHVTCQEEHKNLIVPEKLQNIQVPVATMTIQN